MLDEDRFQKLSSDGMACQPSFQKIVTYSCKRLYLIKVVGYYIFILSIDTLACYEHKNINVSIWVSSWLCLARKFAYEPSITSRVVKSILMASEKVQECSSSGRR